MKMLSPHFTDELGKLAAPKMAKERFADYMLETSLTPLFAFAWYVEAPNFQGSLMHAK